MYAWQFAKAQHVAERNGWTRFVSMQNHYNLLYREEEREMIPLCLDQGVGVIPWSPLARGLLAGNRTRDGETAHRRAPRPTRSPTASTTSPSDFDVVDRVVEVAGDARRAAGADRARLAAAPARRDRADRRRHQARRTSRTPSPRSTLTLHPRRSSASRSPTCPTPSSATISAVDGPGPAPPAGDVGRVCSATSTCAPSRTTRPTPTQAPTHRARRGSRPVPGGDLLDVPCGYGRHAIPLARAAYRVTGVDRSPTLLAEARRRAGDDAPDLVEADYRELPFPDESFDAALNLFTSLGFYGDEEDVKALAEIGRVLRPAGRLVIETMHRDRLVHGFHEQDWRLVGAGRLLLEQRSFDAAAGVAQTTQTLIEKTGERDSRSFAVRVYTATELVAMLNRAGFDDAAATATSRAARSARARGWSSSAAADAGAPLAQEVRQLLAQDRVGRAGRCRPGSSARRRTVRRTPRPSSCTRKTRCTPLRR